MGLTKIEELRRERNGVAERQITCQHKAKTFLSRAEEYDRAHDAAREAGVAGDEKKLREARSHAAAAEEARTFAKYHEEEAGRLSAEIARLDDLIHIEECEELKQQCLSRVAEADKIGREAVAKLSEFLILAKQGTEQFGEIADLLLRMDRDRLHVAANEIRKHAPWLFFAVGISEVANAFPQYDVEQTLGGAMVEGRSIESWLRDFVQSTLLRISFRRV